MNDKPNPNRSRRSTDSRRKASQLDSAKTRSERLVAPQSENLRENLLAGRRSGRVHQGTEGGSVIVAFVRPMHDPETGREWERVFLFEVETPEEIEAAEAWVEVNYPPSKVDGQ